MPDAGLFSGARINDTSIPDAKFSSTVATTNTNSTLVKRDGSGRSQFTDPSAAQDAATKIYVDTAVSGIASGRAWKDAVRLATTAALAAGTYANGTAGVGATFTETANGALTVDGVAVAVGNRILVKDQASQFQNGVYTVTATGSGAAPFVLTRATDTDEAADWSDGTTVMVGEGTANTSTEWTQTTNNPNPFVMGTTNLVFAQTGAGSIAPGSITNTHINAAAAIAWTKIDKTGSSLADFTTRSAADLSSGKLLDARLNRVDNETPTGTIDGSNVTFTLANTPIASSEELFIDALKLIRTTHYTMSGATITFVTNKQPLPGEVLRAYYWI